MNMIFDLQKILVDHLCTSAYKFADPKGQLYDESGKIKMEPIGILHMLHLLIVTSFVLTSAVLLSKLYFSLLREV